MQDSIRFQVDGISCESCARRIDVTLHAYDNVDAVMVDIPGRCVTVTGDRLDEGTLKKTLEDMGFDVLGNS